MVLTRRGWPHASPSRWWFFSGSSGVRVFFVPPVLVHLELVFLPTSKVVELLFLPARSDGGWCSLNPFGLWWLVTCISLFFLLFWQDYSSQDVLFGGVAEPTCRRRCDFWPVFFSLFSLISNLHFSVDFWLTCAPQPRSSSSSALAAASSGSVGHRWSAHGSHAPRSSLLYGVREGHARPFSGRSWRQPVIRRRISVWVDPVTACVPHAPPSGILAFSPTAGSLFWVFFAYVFFVFFSCFFSLSLFVFGSNFMGISVG